MPEPFRNVIKPAQPGVSYRCPCCDFRTLDTRGAYDVCPVCFWEDDGQDDHDASEIRGGPNGTLSLVAARTNFRSFGACDLKFKNSVRSPLAHERNADEA
jgi:hypothetical protein